MSRWTVGIVVLNLCLAIAGRPLPAQVLVDGELSDSLWQHVVATKLAPSEEGVPASTGGRASSGDRRRLSLPECTVTRTQRPCGFRDPRLEALRTALGKFPPRCPLDTRVTSEFQGKGYRREDLAYQSQPGVWVTANLYLPEQHHDPMPGTLPVASSMTFISGAQL